MGGDSHFKTVGKIPLNLIWAINFLLLVLQEAQIIACTRKGAGFLTKENIMNKFQAVEAAIRYIEKGVIDDKQAVLAELDKLLLFLSDNVRVDKSEPLDDRESLIWLLCVQILGHELKAKIMEGLNSKGERELTDFINSVIYETY